MRGPVLPVAALASLAVLSAGCAPVGRDFVRPTPATVELGATTLQQLRARYGAPSSERSWTRSAGLELPGEIGTPFGAPRVPGDISELQYYYEYRGEAGSAPGVEPSRSVRFWFWNDRLVGWQATSSFKADSTVFDERRVEAIRPNLSRREDVVAALGEPSGHRMYPLVPGEAVQVMTWFSFEYDTGVRESRARTLHVLVDGAGKVLDKRFASSSRALPPPPPPSYVPIYVPPPRVRKK